MHLCATGAGPAIAISISVGHDDMLMCFGAMRITNTVFLLTVIFLSNKL